MAHVRNERVAAIAGNRAGDVLLASLAGWLGSRPSAEQLLGELVEAREAAEIGTDDPEKARLSEAALTTGEARATIRRKGEEAAA